MKILDTPRSGKCGQVVAFQSPFGLCLRQLVVPRNTQTPARDHMHAVFGDTSRMWSGTLTQDQRDRWCAAGPKVMSYPRLGQKGPLSGQQFWQAINSVRGCVGLPRVFDPPAPVLFGPNVVGPLTITNDEDGVRLWLAVSGDLTEDVMVFAQAPCSAGRYKRRNVSYLGLVPPPIGGRVEITRLYKAKFGEPRPGWKVFVVTCQEKEGWKGSDYETSAVVPNRPSPRELAAAAALSQPTNPAAPAASGLPALPTPSVSQNPYMYKGGTRGAQGVAGTVQSQQRLANETDSPAGKAPGAGSARDGGMAGDSSGESNSRPGKPAPASAQAGVEV
jgi:hypothetical protein